MVLMDAFKQYAVIVQEANDLKRRIDKLRKDLARLESDGTVVDSVCGGEGGKRHYKIEGMPSRDISVTKTRLQCQIMRYHDALSRIDDFKDKVDEAIMNVPDAETRMMLRCYFCDGMNQTQIAKRFNMDQSNVSRKFSLYGFEVPGEKENSHKNS